MFHLILPLRIEFLAQGVDTLLDINDLLGKPYKAHGRGPNGYDCYGLVIEVEKRLGRELPDLYKIFDKKSEVKNLTISTEVVGLKKTKTPVFGDIVVFKKNGRADHIAVYLKNDDFIHCDGNGVRVMNLNYYNKKGEFYTWLQ